MSKINIGLDVGNSDVKTSLTTTPSGFSTYAKKPFSEEYLKINDHYYIPEQDRFPYTKDKTINENLFIMSCFGIAKEILAIATNKDNKKRRAAKENPLLKKDIIGIQAEIDKIDFIKLGTGLPPTHIASLSDVTKKYYYDHFSDGVEFEYCGYRFSFRLVRCECYPQNFATILIYNTAKNPESIIANYDTYNAVDIGGETVDKIAIIDGKVSISKSDSLPIGILEMQNSIIQQIEMEEGYRLDKIQVIKILQNKKTIIEEKIIDAVKKLANEWYHLIMGRLAIDGFPVLFMGGGSILLKPYIEQKDVVKVYEIIEDPHSNAEAFKRLISREK